MTQKMTEAEKTAAAEKRAKKRAQDQAAYDAATTPERMAENRARHEAQLEAINAPLRVAQERRKANEQRAAGFKQLEHPTPAQWIAEAEALDRVHELAVGEWQAADFDEQDPDLSEVVDMLEAEIATLNHHFEWRATDPEGYEEQEKEWADAYAIHWATKQVLRSARLRRSPFIVPTQTLGEAIRAAGWTPE